MSHLLMKLLLIEYGIITVTCLVEQNWVRALYWIGAMVLQTAVILSGMK